MPKTLVSIFAVVLCLATAACSGGGDDGASGSPSRSFLSIGTAPQGGTFFVIGSAIGEVLNDNAGDKGWQVTAEATKGSQENIRRLDSGDLDIALANAAISYFAVRGTEGWDRAYPIRTVMTLAPNVAFFITPESSGLRTIEDLKGRRVFVGPAGAGFEYFLRPLLGAHGVSYDDFTPINGTQTQAVDYLADGSAAAAFLGGGQPTASITQASTSQDIFFIPFADEAKSTLTDQYLFFRSATVEAGTYRNQEQPFNGLDVGSMHLITRADKDEELVYQLTKTIYENREAVVQRHKAGRAINPRNVVRNTGLEFHPGAIRYYREIGIWADEEGSD